MNLIHSLIVIPKFPKYMAGLIARAALVFVSSVPAFAAQQDAVREESLIGHWVRSAVHQNREMVSADFEIFANHRFHGQVIKNGEKVWVFAGTWNLVGSTFTWHYEQSSIALRGSEKVDADYIISVTPTQVRKRSVRTGKDGTLNIRVRTHIPLIYSNPFQSDRSMA